MVVVSINSVNYGSTGNIMVGVSKVAAESGMTAYSCCACGRSTIKRDVPNQIFIGSILERNLHLRLGHFTGFNGCFSHFGTYKFLKKLDKISPDVIHLHNLHNCYINLPMLFKWIKKRNVKVIWTLHDCWAFTALCPYFDIVGCDRWKTGCHSCPQYREYPATRIDNTKTMYNLKKKWFTGIEDMTIVTPSKWLAGLVKESFLGEYTVKVINNGIDLDIFKPCESDLRSQLGLKDKIVLLGCAAGWGERKGFDVFLELAKRLDDRYKFVLIGVTKEQKNSLPDNIVGIERTQNQFELAKYYSMADLFVNPTREDNFPTVNIESIACGTPVITFKSGGSPEIAGDVVGCVVECNDVNALEKEIINITNKNPFSTQECENKAKEYHMYDKFAEYLKIYECK